MDKKGVDNLIKQLEARAAEHTVDPQPSVLVGFVANYALYVHENMEIWPPGMRLKGLPRGMGMKRDTETGIVYVPKNLLTSGKTGAKKRGYYWDPQGKAGPKFLEGPYRESMDVFRKILYKCLLQKKSLAQALIVCGLYLMRLAQQRVPVDTGNLKAGAFCRLEGKGPANAPIAGGEDLLL